MSAAPIAFGSLTTTAAASGPCPFDGSPACLSASKTGLSSHSMRASAVPAPNPPLSLTGSSSGSTVTLSWGAPASGEAVTTYVIEAGSAPGLANLANFATGSTTTSFSATGIGAGTYYVRVRAQNASGASAVSNEFTLVVGSSCAGAPAAPSGFTATASGSTVTLSWTGSACATSYVLQAGSSTGLSNLANSNVGNVTSYVATGVGAGTYYIRVVAQGAGGQSGTSNEVALTVGSVSTGAADVQPRTRDFGRQGGCTGATLSQAFTVTAPAGVTWTVTFTGSDLDDSAFRSHRGHLDTTSGSGNGTVTFSISVPPQTALLGSCNSLLGTFNYGDTITFRFSNGTSIQTTISWVFLVTGT